MKQTIIKRKNPVFLIINSDLDLLFAVIFDMIWARKKKKKFSLCILPGMLIHSFMKRRFIFISAFVGNLSLIKGLFLTFFVKKRLTKLKKPSH